MNLICYSYVTCFCYSLVSWKLLKFRSIFLSGLKQPTYKGLANTRLEQPVIHVQKSLAWQYWSGAAHGPYTNAWSIFGYTSIGQDTSRAYHPLVWKMWGIGHIRAEFYHEPPEDLVGWSGYFRQTNTLNMYRFLLKFNGMFSCYFMNYIWFLKLTYQ